ncbi:tRNA (guanine-N(7)-)-methyltransferase non-catalytic subunit trm82 [Oleoguttula sp. CCFEE 5521]
MQEDVVTQVIHHPFQCIASLEQGDGQFLLAACGVELLAYSLAGRKVASKWRSGITDQIAETINGHANGSEERPAKKQKTDNKKAPPASRIISMRVSCDQSHVIVVTEDKVIHVLNITGDGHLTELSRRAMPKRPCAVRVMPDPSTILIGDKFGDVYSLPLLVSESKDQSAQAEAQDAERTAEPALFKPSATPLTVHTKRNLRALESQKKQKIVTPRKEPLAFDHRLLLGHVSMLTDMVHAAREVDGKTRRYILTADRDEHIRVSRGPPQSHVIEGYCLAHTDFVSKICLIPGTELLVSGGGNDWVGVWDWPRCELRAKLDLRKAISHLLPSNDDKLAVSGIWAVPVSHQVDRWALCVACEKLPALIFIDCSALGDDAPADASVTAYKTDAPVLDVAYYGGHAGYILIAHDDRRLDGRRVRGVRVNAKGDENETRSTLDISEATALDEPFMHLSASTLALEENATLDSFLYTTANLRKRGGWDEDNEA